MANISKSVAHVDISGAGFGNTFMPAQKCTLAYAQANLQKRGVAVDLAYTYKSDIAEATFTLKDNDGQPVAELRLSERQQNFGDAKRPHIHTVYNYDVYVGTPTQGWLQIAFAQIQENRGVPARIKAEIADSLNALAREHGLFPKVRELVFGR